MGLIVEPSRPPLIRHASGFGFGAGGRAAKKRTVVASGGGAPPFDPATLTLDAWSRASYSGAPWDGIASAGASDTNPLIAGAAPGTGSAVNGLTPADFNGSSHYLVGTDTTAAMLGSTAWTLIALVNADTLDADAGLSANEPIFSDDQALVGVEVYSTGIRVFQFDSGSNPFGDTTTALTTGTWTMVNARWTGSAIQVGKNGAWSAGAAVGSISGSTGAARFGLNYSAAFFDGKILEIMVSPTSLSDVNVNNVKSYFNDRYALSL